MTAFVFSLFVTAVLTIGMYLYAKRRPVGATLTWGEAFIGGVVVFFWFIMLYGIVPNAWLQWVGGGLRWRSDKLGIPLGPLHHWRVSIAHTHVFTLDLLKNNRRYLGFLPVAKGAAWPAGITFFGRGKLNFNAATLGDIVATLIYGVALGINMKGWLWWQARGKAAPAQRELPTSAYGRPLVKKV